MEQVDFLPAPFLPISTLIPGFRFITLWMY